METNQKPRTTRLSTTLVVVIIVVSLLAGGLLGYSISNLAISESMSNLEDQLLTLQQQLANLQATQDIINQNNTFFLEGNVSLSQLYQQVKDSIVIIRAISVTYDVFRRPYYTQVQGSGFIYNYTGTMVVVTNYHVVQDTINITVTLVNGNGYAAELLGSDPYADLAVLSTNASETEFKPLEVVSISSLKVGDPVIAVGNPYGLAGSMTTGITSALGRTITEEMTGSYPIANVIQTSAPINPGNSGGPLLNYQGQVIGITTAIVTDSQGLGFAIPSSTILREIGSLVTTGSYNLHPWLGAAGTDMTYEIASVMNVNVTYGWLITQVTSGGPAYDAGLRGGTKTASVAGESVTIGGDVIIALNGTRITNMDDLSTYLEENTSPNQTVIATIVRSDNETMSVPIKLGTRPALT